MKRNLSTSISGFLASIVLAVTAVGCTSANLKSAAAPPAPAATQVAANDRSPDSLRRNSLSIVGGYRILNLGGGHETILTLLQARESTQLIRAKCLPAGNHSVNVLLQLEYGEDSHSKVLDLRSASVTSYPQASMIACATLLDKLFETSTFYPAFINFGEDSHKFTVSF